MEKILMGRPLMENPLCPFILLPSLPVPYSPYSAVILLAESPQRETTVDRSGGVKSGGWSAGVRGRDGLLDLKKAMRIGESETGGSDNASEPLVGYVFCVLYVCFPCEPATLTGLKSAMEDRTGWIDDVSVPFLRPTRALFLMAVQPPIICSTYKVVSPRDVQKDDVDASPESALEGDVGRHRCKQATALGVRR